MLNKNLTVILLTLFLLPACASMNYPSAKLKTIEDDFHSYSYTSDLRATHVMPADSKFKFCMEPAPDTAYSQDESEGFSLSFLNFGGKDSEEDTEGSEDLPLAGRTGYLLLARELNYRICEMAINFNLSKEEYMELYKANLKVIEKVGGIEAKNSKYDTNMTITTGVSSTLSTTESDTKSSIKNGSTVGGQQPRGQQQQIQNRGSGFSGGSSAPSSSPPDSGSGSSTSPGSASTPPPSGSSREAGGPPEIEQDEGNAP